MTVRLLAAGDLHIGAVSTRLPDTAVRADASAAAAWLRIVDEAIARQVDALLIAGDLIDRQNHYFEAVEALAKGLQKLGNAGIETLAIAGNHDADVLREVARTKRIQEFGRFKVLGLAGWECAPMAAALQLQAWSFPKTEYLANPFDSYASLADSAVGGVGLVHGDIDASGGRYAPIPRGSLPQGAACWIAGHIHRPQFDAAARLLIPGSPQALAPDERGQHGVWLIDLEGGVLVGQPQLIPISSVRYDQVTVDVTEVVDAADLRPAIYAKLHEQLASWRLESPPLRYAWAALRVTGTTRWVEEAAGIVQEAAGEITVQDGDATLTVGDAISEVHPPLDLIEIARGSDVAAVLARLVIAIESGHLSDEETGLFDTLEKEAAHTHFQQAFAGISAGPVNEQAAPDRPDVPALVRAQAERLLVHLLKRQGGAA